jgi:HEAT repeat protein
MRPVIAKALVLSLAAAAFASGLAAQTGTPAQTPAPTQAQALQPVTSALNQELIKIIPEIASGYIDLNGNGKADQGGDVNEMIPESRVKDGQLQSQEILDFIVSNWRFIPLDKLRAVQTAVKSTPGAINELIAIDFASSLEEAVRQKSAMGDSLYLTPSAYKEAMDKLSGIIASMTTAYKKEGQKADADFVSSRDALFAMIEKGYPLPGDLPADERAALSTAMLNTAMKEQKANAGKARTAIKTLGRLASVDAAPFLLGLVDSPDLQLDAMRALGDIGYKGAVPTLAKQVKSGTSPDARKAGLQALGAIGGAEGLDAILELLKPANKAALPKDFLPWIAQDLAGVAQKGTTDARVQGALKELSTSDDPATRKAAVSGIGAFASPASSDALLAVLAGDKDPQVRAQAVAALSKQKSDAIAPALIKTLKEKDLDPALEIAAINALGDNSLGSQAVQPIVDDLADKNPGVRAASSVALLKLYPANAQLVAGALTRSLLASQDEAFLSEGTSLLSTIADPTTLPALLTLLQKPAPEVKRNVAWAFYKIRSSSNPRVVDELQKLVTNESEAISVRVAAVRALGAIAFDSPQLNIWQTLVATSQMRGEKYATLRFYAVWALGRVGAGKPQAIAALSRIASRDADVDQRKQAVVALRDMATPDAATEAALAAAYPQAADPELQVLILEALADMGSDKCPSLAGELLAGKSSLAQKRRVMSALAASPDEASAQAILDAARNAQLQDLSEAMLEGYPASFMASLVSRRLKTETDKSVISVLESLDARFSQ